MCDRDSKSAFRACLLHSVSLLAIAGRLAKAILMNSSGAEMYRRSGLVISREQGLRYDAGFAVPVLMS